MQTTTNINRNQRTPNYKLLAVVAILFNPLLGFVALVANDHAKRRLSSGDMSSANFFYFVTISFSVFSIGSTVTAICMLSMHVLLQSHLHEHQLQQQRSMQRRPIIWCVKETMKLNITMEKGVSIDEFCDPENETFWLSTIDRVRLKVSEKKFSS